LAKATEVQCGCGGIVGPRLSRVSGKLAGCPMPKASLVSVVENDQYFRESMIRLMSSLGYSVETFAFATDLLASARLGCLIADVTCAR
jgi:hypothetical protein